MNHSVSFHLIAALFAAAICSAARAENDPAIYNEPFSSSTHHPALQLYGSAVVNNESLLLTPDALNQVGLAVIGAGKVSGFNAQFTYFFNHTGPGNVADGTSFNLGDIPDGIIQGPAWEKGPGNGLTVSFDIYDFDDTGPPTDFGIRLLYNGAVIASAPNVITSADRGQIRPVLVNLLPDGRLSLTYNGAVIFNNVQTNYVPTPSHRFSFAARTGSQFAEQRIDSIILRATALSSDLCRDPLPIHGDGLTWWDNNAAATDGIATCASPSGNTGLPFDVWYCWTAAKTGLTTFSTVGFNIWDNKMAIYRGCNICPTGLGLLACNDNFVSDLASLVSLRVEAGSQYLIRLGGSPTPVFDDKGQGIIAIGTTPDCPADFDHSGVRTIDDLFIYINVWLAGCP